LSADSSTEVLSIFDRTKVEVSTKAELARTLMIEKEGEQCLTISCLSQ